MLFRGSDAAVSDICVERAGGEQRGDQPRPGALPPQNGQHGRMGHDYENALETEPRGDDLGKKAIHFTEKGRFVLKMRI